jgi:WD40 repeat protein
VVACDVIWSPRRTGAAHVWFVFAGVTGPEAIAIPPTPIAMTMLPGKPILAISCSDMVITFWDVADDFAFLRQMTTVVPHVRYDPWLLPPCDGVFQVLISHEQVLLCAGKLPNILYSVAANGREISVWDVESGFAVGRIPAHRDVITDLKFFAPVNYLVTASLDKTISVYTLDSESGLPVLQFLLHGHKRGVGQV